MSKRCMWPGPTWAWLVVCLCAPAPTLAGPPGRTNATLPSAAEAAPVGADMKQLLTQLLGTPQLLGQAGFRYFGFSIYHAQLWVGQRPSDAALAWAQQPVVLSLQYQRDFKGEAIAQRSIDEMRRHPAMREATQDAWLQMLKAVLPDVREGDRLIGVYQPGQGLQMWHEAAQLRQIGTAPDPLMARVFMGIWLDPSTSAPELRQRLLGIAQP